MKYLLRLLMFLLKNIVLVMVAGALLVTTFTFAMNASNIYIIASDGMRMRAGVVMGVDDSVELTKFFTRGCLEGDPLLAKGIYEDYTIRSFDYRSDIEWLWTWPWENIAEITITEHVPFIDGEMPVSKQNEEQRATPHKILPPAWSDARYKLTFVMTDGRWKISELTMIETVEPLATRVPSYTPAPSETQQITSSPQATPAASPSPTLAASNSQ